jgi:hypothetical protein
VAIPEFWQRSISCPRVRILIVDTMYPGFLHAHYAQHPGLANESYDVQWRALMDRFFGTGDAYSHYLGALGHPAHEFVVNCSPLQRRWAIEHGFRSRPLQHRYEQVVAQADEFGPDVVYVQDISAMPDRILDRLKRGRLLVGQIATEAPGVKRLRHFDLLLTALPRYVDRFRAVGIRSDYLRIGFDPRVLGRIGERVPPEGAVFVGSLGRRQHESGNLTIARAAERVPIDFWGPDSGEWPTDSPIRRRFRGEAWGLDMFRILARARISVNRHGDVAGVEAANMRLFEATGVGSLLLTDEKQNLDEFFAVGREVVTYRDAGDLADKIKFYLEHEDERAAIARAGHERTLRDHTYAVRMADLVAFLE